MVVSRGNPPGVGQQAAEMEDILRRIAALERASGGRRPSPKMGYLSFGLGLVVTATSHADVPGFPSITITNTTPVARKIVVAINGWGLTDASTNLYARGNIAPAAGISSILLGSMRFSTSEYRDGSATTYADLEPGAAATATLQAYKAGGSDTHPQLRYGWTMCGYDLGPLV